MSFKEYLEGRAGGWLAENGDDLDPLDDPEFGKSYEPADWLLFVFREEGVRLRKTTKPSRVMAICESLPMKASGRVVCAALITDYYNIDAIDDWASQMAGYEMTHEPD